MMKMTFHESYGEVAVAQLITYRRHNVSPADHFDLVESFGDGHETIIAYVERNAAANRGQFNVFDLWMGRYL